MYPIFIWVDTHLIPPCRNTFAPSHMLTAFPSNRSIDQVDGSLLCFWGISWLWWPQHRPRSFLSHRRRWRSLLTSTIPNKRAFLCTQLQFHQIPFVLQEHPISKRAVVWPPTVIAAGMKHNYSCSTKKCEFGNVSQLDSEPSTKAKIWKISQK